MTLRKQTFSGVRWTTSAAIERTVLQIVASAVITGGLDSRSEVPLR